MTARHAPVATFMLLAGCAPEGSFPSLAPRPAERVLTTEEPARVQSEVPSDSGLRLRVLELRQQAADGDRAFDAAYGPAEAAIGRAGAAETESWVDAQQALSLLEAARARTMQALTQLDQLAIGRAQVPTNADDIAAINGIIGVVEEIAGRQQQRLEALRARLR